MKQRNLIGILLAIAMLTASLWGCASAGSPDGTTQPIPDSSDGALQTDSSQIPPDTGTTQEPDPTEETSGFVISTLPPSETLDGPAVTMPTEQQRLRNMTSGWTGVFNGENGCFILVGSVDELNQALSSRGGLDDQADLSAYDDAFFRNNRLAVIPRSSNSGSVRYEALVSADEKTVQITLEATLDGYGTDDMADWLVFVTLPLEDYPDGLVITVTGTAGTPGNILTS